MDGPITPSRAGWLHMLRSTSTAGTVHAVMMLVPLLLSAQTRGEQVRVLSGTALRAVPSGEVIGVLSRNLDAPVESAQGSAVRIRLEGFVSLSELQLEPARSRAVVGAARTGPKGSKGADVGATLRTTSRDDGPALAELRRGAIVFPGSKLAGYLAVSRPVWIDRSRLARVAPSRPAAVPAAAPVAARPPSTNAPVPAPQALPAGLPLETNGSAVLRKTPDGDPLATLPAGVLVTELARENGWTHVRLEGWVPTKSVADAASRAAGALSAADLRADPDGLKGRIVRWSVEALSYQLADGLRRELNGEPYLLARGPGRERTILYLAVPDSLVGAARALPPLTTIAITARVRSGRSQPAGVPILDLLELSRR